MGIEIHKAWVQGAVREVEGLLGRACDAWTGRHDVAVPDRDGTRPVESGGDTEDSPRADY